MCLIYFSPPWGILRNSKEIKGQQELKVSLKLWRKELRIDKRVFIFSKFLDSSKDSDYQLAEKYGGAFVDLADEQAKQTGEKRYRLGIKPKIKFLLILEMPANEGALVHELSHLKLEHLEKQKDYEHKWYSWFLDRKYEKEANNELIKHKALLSKRKIN